MNALALSALLALSTGIGGAGTGLAPMRPQQKGPPSNAPDRKPPARDPKIVPEPPPPDAPPEGPRTPVDRVVAMVNGDVVTMYELEQRAGLEWDRVERLPAGAEHDRARKAALRRSFEVILAEKLFENEAKNLEIDIGDAQVEAAIADIKKRNNFDDAQLDRALGEQGLDRPTFKAQVKKELTSFSVLQYKVRSRVKVSDEDLRAFYQAHPQEFAGEEEVRARHVFLPLAPDAPATEVARVGAEAERLRARLASGEDFAAIARTFSKAPTAADGGELPWLKRGQIQKALEDAIFPMKVNELSRPIRTETGVHLVQVLEKRRAGRTFEDAKEEIRSRLLEEQGDTYRAQYLADLKKDALVETRIDELKD